MKNYKGEELPQPYYDIATMRREKNPTHWFISSPEGSEWWCGVYFGNYPMIPDTSLAELDAWRESKIKTVLVTDFKGMYEEVRDKLVELQKNHDKLKNQLTEILKHYEHI